MTSEWLTPAPCATPLWCVLGTRSCRQADRRGGKQSTLQRFLMGHQKIPKYQADPCLELNHSGTLRSHCSDFWRSSYLLTSQTILAGNDRLTILRPYFPICEEQAGLLTAHSGFLLI
jgi:hypothetical protein